MAVCNPAANPARPDSVGPALKVVTPAQQQWAASIANDLGNPIGAVFVRDFDGVTIVAWVTCHSYTVNADGSQTSGAYHGVSLHQATSSTPIAPAEVPVEVPVAKPGPSLIEFVFLATALFGTAFAASRALFDHQHRMRNPQHATHKRCSCVCDRE